MSLKPSHNAIPIWGGRWQPPHLGHEWIFRRLLSLHQQICVAIVNPLPRLPPVAPEKFPRFEPSLNPLSYFERLVLWRVMAQDARAIHRVTIIPSWHPRDIISLEETFLPPKSRRFWAIPHQSDEEWMKRRDFKQLGETVDSSVQVPLHVLGVNSSEIRYRWQHNLASEDLLPTSIRPLATQMQEGRLASALGQCAILVVADDLPTGSILAEFSSVCNLAPRSVPIFALAVHVRQRPPLPWWFGEEARRHNLRMRERIDAIAHVWQAIATLEPIFLPLFVVDNAPMLLNEFLPDISVRKWFVVSDDDSSVPFISALAESDEPFGFIRPSSYATTVQEIANSQMQQVKSRLHYDLRAKQKQEDKQMSGFKFGAHTVVHGNIVNVEGKVTGSISGGNEAATIAQLRNAVSEYLDSDEQARQALQQLLVSTPVSSEIAANMRGEVTSLVESRKASGTLTKVKAEALVRDLAVSAAGSALISVIIEALRAAFGH